MGIRESDVIDYIRRSFQGGDILEDDCGPLPVPAWEPGATLLVTTDLMESDQHFAMAWHPPEMLGRKLLMVNLSDLDASGAVPLGFTLTLALGPEVEAAWLYGVLDGLAKAAVALNVPVLGGDTVGRRQGVGLGMTAFGLAKRWLKRDGLQVGDGIFVDHMPGASFRGLQKLMGGERWNPERPDADLAAHLDPRPQLGLGVRLAALSEVHACMDLSDGLSKDLASLARTSRKTIRVRDGLDAEVLQGGEDYARCFGASLSLVDLENCLGVSLIQVGDVIDQQDTPVLYYDGRGHVPLPDMSFNHFYRA